MSPHPMWGRRNMADPHIAMQVRAMMGPSMDRMAVRIVDEMWSSRLPVEALPEWPMPEAPGVVGFWLTARGARDMGLRKVPRAGAWAWVEDAHGSVSWTARNHLGRRVATRVPFSGLRFRCAALLREHLNLIPRPAPDKTFSFVLSKADEETLTEWLIEHVEVGWWTGDVLNLDVAGAAERANALAAPLLDRFHAIEPRRIERAIAMAGELADDSDA